MDTRLKLKELECELERQKAPILSLFQKGLSEEYIFHLFKQHSLRPTDDLHQLYMWKNGLKFEAIPGGKLCFIFSGIFFPLEESLGIYGESQDDGFKNLFPILSDDHYLIDLDRNSKNFGQVLFYCPSLQILEPTRCFDSLFLMIETTLVCFKEGAFGYTSDGFFEQDYDQSYRIAKSLNPQSEYWD